MSDLLDDARRSLRSLATQPGFLFLAVLTIGLGVGANTTMFGVVQAILLRPLPWPQPEQLVALWDIRPDGQQNRVSARNFLAWKDRTKSFAQIAGLSPWTYNVTGDGVSDHVIGGQVSAELFPMLGVKPALGRAIRTNEDSVQASGVVILSNALWQSRFGSSPDVIGKNISLNGKQHEIIGVMPADFQFISDEFKLWVPLAPDDPTAADRHTMAVFARIAPGRTLEQARAEIAAIAKSMETEYPRTNRDWKVSVTPLLEDQVGHMRSNLLALWGGAAMLLLIAVSNVANLLLARGTARQKELAVRCAMGAGPGRLVRQLLTESLALGFLGGIVGIGLAAVAVRVIASAASISIPRLAETRIDPMVLLVSILTSVIAAVAFGAIPAWRAVSPDLVGLLKEESRGSTGGRSLKRWQQILVSCQIALSLVLLASAALLVESIARLQRMDRGFEPANVLTLQISLPETADRPAIHATSRRMLERLSALPGVTAAGLSSGIPLDGRRTLGMAYAVPGKTPTDNSQRPAATTQLVSPGYFAALSLRLREGRTLEDADREGTKPVVVISHSLEQMYWPGQSAVGHQIMVGSPSVRATGNTVREIVGVVDDIAYPTGQPDEPLEIYMPFEQTGWPSLYLYLRTRTDPESVANAARRAIHEVDPGIAVATISTLEDQLWDLNSRPRFDSQLAGLFAGLALLLTLVGVYGVISYLTVQQTGEIRVRIALGAEPRDIMAMVVRETLKMTLAGLALGLAGYYFLARLLESFLYGVSGAPYITVAGVALFLAAVSIVASLLPAWRVARLDPAEVLHQP